MRVFFRTEGKVKGGNQELEMRCTTYLLIESFQKGKEFQNTYWKPQKLGQSWAGEGHQRENGSSVEYEYPGLP